MSQQTELVRDHYQAAIPDQDALLAKLATALDGMDGPITAERLAGFDQFHVGGLAATAELARRTGITADLRVLDAGSGLGGSSRYLADNFGCRITRRHGPRPPTTARCLCGAKPSPRMEGAGFRVRTWDDVSETAKGWIAQQQQRMQQAAQDGSAVPALSPGMVVGQRMQPMVANFGRNIAGGRVRLVMGLCEAA